MTTPIRVLRVIDRLNVGGPAVQVSVLAHGLDPSRFEQRILVGRPGPDEGDYEALRAADLPVDRIPGLGRAPHVGHDAAALAHVARAIREFRPHIVHTHKAKAGMIGRVAAWGNRVPATVHTFHGHLLKGYFSPTVTRGIIEVERRFARRTTALVAVGAQVRDDLVAAGIGRAEQFTIVPPGVHLDAPPAPADARRALGLPEDGTLVTFVGRLTRIKRPERFVDLAFALTAEHPDAVFAIAGDGELREEMEARAAPLGDRFVFLGWRSDVETVNAASDVVVLTSDNEGMPVSLIEAGVIGVPVVTTAAGSAAEVVVDGSTGFVTGVAIGDLAAATSRLLGDPALRRKMGAAASERARTLFGGERLVADIAALYERVARA